MPSSVFVRVFVIAGLFLSVASGIRAEESIIGPLQDFEAKLAALNTTTTSADPRQQQMTQMVAQRFIEQLRGVEYAIEHGDQERAITQLNGLYANALPPDLVKVWSALVDKTVAALEAGRVKALNEWSAQVDEVVQATPKVCLGAKGSGDLDAMLVRVAALQQQRPGNSNDIVSQRANRRLSSVASTLESWMNYLDFKTAGNTKAANGALRSLSTNDSLLPVLRVADITARIEEEQGNQEAVIVQVYRGIQSPGDIAAAVAKLAGLGKSAEGDMNAGVERRFLETLQQAKEAFDKGDLALAIKGLANSRTFGGSTNFTSYRDKLQSMIERDCRLEVIRKASGLRPGADEPVVDFEKRAMDTFYAKGDWDGLAGLMAALDDLSSSRKTYAEARVVLERFRAALRFEAANDPAFAVAEYRRVLRANGGDYIPQAQAGEALKRIQAAHPELFNPTDSRVLAEIESLRQEMQQVFARASMMQGGQGFPVRR